MPNSLQSSAIASPASRRATNCSLSSITEHSFQGITPSPSTGRKCHLCVRYNVLPMSQVAHQRFSLCRCILARVTVPKFVPCLLQNWLDCLMFEGLNRSLLCLGSDVAVAFEHGG